MKRDGSKGRTSAENIDMDALRAQLRDPAEDAAVVGRLWARIDTSVSGANVSQGASELAAPAFTGSRSWRTGRVLLLAASFAALAFGGGVYVGGVALKEEAPVLAADPDRPTDSIFASGSKEKSFVLPNGSALTLKPDSLVEVLRTSTDSMTLSLLRGSVSIEASEGQSFAVLAGEARVTAAAGSHVSLTRNAEDVDVRVAQGAAEVSSPAGRHRIEQGQALARVPTYAWTLSQHQPTPRPEPDEEAVTPPSPAPVAQPKATPESTSQPEVAPPAPTNLPPAPIASLRSWRALANQGKYDEAFDALQEGVGFEATLANAQSATELTALSEIAGRKHPELRLRALHRAADEFASEADGRAAAAELALLYQSSNRELAAKYRQIGSQASALAETLFCSELRGFSADSNPVERRHLRARALEYATTYPKGTCAEQANYILAETKADAPPEPAPSEEPTDATPPSAPSAAPAPSSDASAKQP